MKRFKSWLCTYIGLRRDAVGSTLSDKEKRPGIPGRLMLASKRLSKEGSA